MGATTIVTELWSGLTVRFAKIYVPMTSKIKKAHCEFRGLEVLGFKVKSLVKYWKCYVKYFIILVWLGVVWFHTGDSGSIWGIIFVYVDVYLGGCGLFWRLSGFLYFWSRLYIIIKLYIIVLCAHTII